jgi:hypothetical protein
MFRWLHTLLPTHASPAELVNIKGRERGDVLIPEGPLPGSNELFALEGSIAIGHSPNGFTWAPFNLACTTPFARFEGVHNIVHVAHIQRSESIPEWLPWWLLGSAIPVELRHLRFGFEQFSSRFRITSFGAVPIVSDSLIIDVREDQLMLQVTTNQPRWKPCNPFKTIPTFHSSATVLDTICKASLATTFAAELARILHETA